jgi:hypothetical protein
VTGVVAVAEKTKTMKSESPRAKARGLSVFSATAAATSTTPPVPDMIDFQTVAFLHLPRSHPK